MSESVYSDEGDVNEMCMPFKEAEVLCESVEVRTITEKRSKTSMRK